MLRRNIRYGRQWSGFSGNFKKALVLGIVFFAHGAQETVGMVWRSRLLRIHEPLYRVPAYSRPL